MTVGVNGNVKYGDCSSMKEDDKLESILITAAKGLFKNAFPNSTFVYFSLLENSLFYLMIVQ